MLGPMTADEAHAPADGPDQTPDGVTQDPDGDVRVVDNPDAGRWELREGDRVIGLARYAIVPATESAPERVVFFHTEVRPEYEGRGLAARLARAALDATIASGRTIVAICPYIRAYVRRHREQYAEHVAPPTRADVDAMDRATGNA